MPVKSDMAEEFQAYREFQKEMKWKRYEDNKNALISSGFPFVEKPNGHFIIGQYDFWATTGLFIDRITKQRGRGVGKLLKRLEKNNE